LQNIAPAKMKKDDFNIGQQFYCPSDHRTREIIDIDSSKVTLQCLDCTAAFKPLVISVAELNKKIQWKIFVLRTEKIVDALGLIKAKENIKKTEHISTEVKTQETEIKAPPIQAKPIPKPIPPKESQSSLF